MGIQHLIDPLQIEGKLFQEAKQVGVLYHFIKSSRSSPEVLSSILKKGLESDQKGYVSFTRNFDLGSGYYLKRAYIRIAIDGNKLSEKYKIEPFNDASSINKRNLPYINPDNFGTEAEERIITTKPIPIKDLIIRVDIYAEKLSAECNTISFYLKQLNFYKEVLDHFDVPYITVGRWKPVK